MSKRINAIFASFAWSAAIFYNNTTLQAQCIERDGGTPIQANGAPCNNSISTALPFLRITPDARFGALGDAGIALAPDANSLHFNASNIAFAERDLSVSATYTPWLRALGLADVYLTYLSAYKNIDKFQTIAGGLRFFSLGQVQYTDDQGNALQQVRPRELEANFAYARKLSNSFAVGLGVKYAYSNLGTGYTSAGDVLRPAHAVAADISFTYKKPLKINDKKANLTIGLAFSNIGTKVSYTRSANRDYLPANAGLGAAFEYNIDDHNSITFAIDINKYMVPTPVPRTLQSLDNNGDTVYITNPRYDENGNGIADYKELSVPSSILSSFSDAPSFKEELQELMYSFGLEYWYNKQFALRLGHYNESKTKGNRKYVTVGLGIRYSVFNLNLSYLIPAFNAQRNPLDNTLRFSIVMDFGESRANAKRKTTPKPPTTTTTTPTTPTPPATGDGSSEGND